MQRKKKTRFAFKLPCTWLVSSLLLLLPLLLPSPLPCSPDCPRTQGPLASASGCWNFRALPPHPASQLSTSLQQFLCLLFSKRLGDLRSVPSNMALPRPLSQGGLPYVLSAGASQMGAGFFWPPHLGEVANAGQLCSHVSVGNISSVEETGRWGRRDDSLLLQLIYLIMNSTNH